MGLREFHFNVWSGTARWKPPKGRGPSPDLSTLLARTIQDMQTFHYYEHQRVIVGLTDDQLTEELVQLGKKTALRNLHVTLWFDPEYKQREKVWCETTDGEDACWLHRKKASLNPGVHPKVWYKCSRAVQEGLI